MPGWAYIVIALGGPLVFGKAYDIRAKRRGHRPGTGQEPPIDLTHYQSPMPPAQGQAMPPPGM
jgi:hypothetical protein